jgi:hypothetical protein
MKDGTSNKIKKEAAAPPLFSGVTRAAQPQCT